MKAVNLIPSEQRRAQPTGKGAGGAYVLLGLLSVLLAMAVAYVLTANQVNERETRAEEARQEADALEAQVARLGSFTNFASIKEQRLASVVATAQTRFDWERLMREVSRVMPEGSWLQTTQASVLGEPGSEAAAAGAEPAAASAPPSPAAVFTGCTAKQSEVARILVRLRALHRVTDVELNEAVREQDANETSIDSCGRFYKFDVTVKFATVVASEAPQGTNNVPASLGGGS